MKAIEENCEEEIWIHWQKLISLGVIRQKEPVFTIVDRVLKVEEGGDYGMGKTMKCLRHTLEDLTDREDSR
tara:strand:- start:597 stop:809 length:213 start_codon:yes stop_codon:yes gene_type:complete